MNLIFLQRCPRRAGQQYPNSNRNSNHITNLTSNSNTNLTSNSNTSNNIYITACPTIISTMVLQLLTASHSKRHTINSICTAAGRTVAGTRVPSTFRAKNFVPSFTIADI